MPRFAKSVLYGLILANPIAASQAQLIGGSHQVGAHHPIVSRHGSVPYQAFVFSGSAGIGPGGQYPGIMAYRPTGLGLASQYGGLAPSAGPLTFPTGQEGPGGLMLPHAAGIQSSSPATASSRTNQTRANSLMEVGDRAFRGGNYRRAGERYQLAAKVNHESPLPHIRLAQIDILRSDYSKAAAHLRDAVAAAKKTGWLHDAPDIQSLYGEPGDFAKQLARLESHLQTHPNDRNAWFVLGAENHFSGRYQPAADAFMRLTNKGPDEALTAFLDAAIVANRIASHP